MAIDTDSEFLEFEFEGLSSVEPEPVAYVPPSYDLNL